MARGFRIHSNAVFNPFSYQELIAPLNEYEQAYNKMQDAMLAAGEEANQYKQLIDTDEYASGVLRGYNDALAEMSGKLSSEGLKTINRNSLLSLRRRYNNEVKPINDAAKTLAGLQDMYRQAYAKDNTLMRGAMPSIRDLVENPGATPQMVSGVQLYNQGAAASKSASLRNFKETPLGSRIIRGYMEQVQERGYSQDVVNAFMQDASQIPELAAEIANIQQMYNTAGLQNPTQANRFIMQGILDGIQYDRKTDYKYDQLGAEMRAAARAKATSGDDMSSLNKYLKPFNLYSQNEIKEAARNVSNYKKYFTQSADGTWKLNEEGRKQYNKQGPNHPEYGMYGRYTSENPFRDFVDSISGNADNIDEAWTRYYNEHQNETYDAHKATSYRYTPQSDDLTIAQRAVETLGTKDKKGNLVTYDYDNKTGRYVESDSVKASDVKNYSDIEISGSGIMVNATLKDGNTVQFKLPASLSSYDYENATRNSKTLKEKENAWISNVEALNKAFREAGYNANFTANDRPEDIIRAAGAIGGQAGANAFYADYINYINTQKGIYDSVANMLRAIDSTSSKL